MSWGDSGGLFRPFFDRVYAYVARSVGDVTLAEDLTQEAFLKMHRGIEQMKFLVHNDGRKNEMLPIDAMERMKLSMTHDAGLLPEFPQP